MGCCFILAFPVTRGADESAYSSQETGCGASILEIDLLSDWGRNEISSSTMNYEGVSIIFPRETCYLDEL